MDKSMIAPCGLNCAVCREALRRENPCVGCRNEGVKGAYCAGECPIVRCETRRSLPGGFCDGCPRYPCRELAEKESWYANEYPMIESLMGNLAYIRRHGSDAFLRREEQRWTCPDCGSLISVHEGLCSGCGRRYSDRVRSHSAE